ncbi:hypothetical protein ACIBI4_07065 [Streptomyces sp. NPDC050418]|uniref:hypothetical protein n=1 Tax=Streptomyces sp. NPDC050418 TaxID=3365612 RepID=UPI00378C9337
MTTTQQMGVPDRPVPGMIRRTGPNSVDWRAVAGEDLSMFRQTPFAATSAVADAARAADFLAAVCAAADFPAADLLVDAFDGVRS